MICQYHSSHYPPPPLSSLRSPSRDEAEDKHVETAVTSLGYTHKPTYQQRLRKTTSAIY